MASPGFSSVFLAHYKSSGSSPRPHHCHLGAVLRDPVHHNLIGASQLAEALQAARPCECRDEPWNLRQLMHRLSSVAESKPRDQRYV